ncbi:hypothetical protein SAMN05216311_10854 [Chitinophaga sp. CF418]|nr:hypothetical protein SAMN05216311_10854 [Chitinophaga sp. CF418]
MAAVQQICTFYNPDMSFVLSVYCKFLRFSEHYLRKNDDLPELKNQTKNVLTIAGTVSRNKWKK